MGGTRGGCQNVGFGHHEQMPECAARTTQRQSLVAVRVVGREGEIHATLERCEKVELAS